MQNILITGAGGFIGSHLMDVFPNAVGFDTFLTGRRENNDRVIELDILNRQELYSLANDVAPEIVIHCAASYDNPDLWHRDTDINIAGGINASIVAKHHNAHLVYFQTILPPISSYAISKIASEQYQRISGVSLTVLRLANIYGPRNLSGPIPVFYKRITQGQPCMVVDTTRDMVYISDLINAIHQVIKYGYEGTYDVCSGVQTPIMELFQEVAACLEHEEIPPLVPPDPDDVQGTISPINSLPMWVPYVPLANGIRHTLESYYVDGIDNTYTHLRMKG